MADLKVRVYVGHLAHHPPWCNAFAVGLNRHGIRPIMTTPDNPQACDVAVSWGIKEPAALKSGENYIVLEAPPIRAAWPYYASAGWNGLAGHGDYCNQNVPGDRGEFFTHLLQPFHDGNYILIMGQCRGDTAVAGVNLEEWAEHVIEALAEETDAPVYFRPHPGDGGMQTSAPTMHGDLGEALAGAQWVITYNSTSGVDAALAGCAVSAFDEGSMAWDIAGHGLEMRRTRRRPWLDRLAYCQWTQEEMANGDTWEHLKAHLQ